MKGKSYGRTPITQPLILRMVKKKTKMKLKIHLTKKTNVSKKIFDTYVVTSHIPSKYAVPMPS